MRLSRRVAHLVRAMVRSGLAAAPAGRSVPLERLERERQHMHRALARAAGRRQRLEQELAAAEQQGQAREALRLRRELAELVRSMEQLQAALDRLRARLELARSADDQAPAGRQPTRLAADTPGEASSQAPPAQSADLEARKARLSGGSQL